MARLYKEPIAKKNRNQKQARKKKSICKTLIKPKIVTLEKQDTVTFPFKDARFLSSGCVINESASKAPFPDKPETVNHPYHYGGEHNPYEAIKVIEAWELNFRLGSVLKYINRV